jgi:hypothetical protein
VRFQSIPMGFSIRINIHFECLVKSEQMPTHKCTLLQPIRFSAIRARCQRRCGGSSGQSYGLNDIIVALEEIRKLSRVTSKNSHTTKSARTIPNSKCIVDMARPKKEKSATKKSALHDVVTRDYTIRIHTYIRGG